MSRQISIKKGDTETIIFTITDDVGAAVNLTGSTVYFTVKKKIDDPDNKAIIQKSWTSHTTPAGGITTLVLSKDDTYKQVGVYLWDIQIKASGGEITTADLGEFIIGPHLTYTIA